MTSHVSRPDMVDRAAGLADSQELLALRAPRPEFIQGAEACRSSVLAPKDALGLSPDLRMAIAGRVARIFRLPGLIDEYPIPEDPAFRAMAMGEMPADRLHAAIASHADMVAGDPSRASENDLQALLAAGLTVPQIVALSELIAFVAFQAQLVAGLSALGAAR